MDVISMVTFPFFNAHVSENVWPATWIQPPPHPPKMNQHWKPTINHDSRALISYKLSFERFKMLLQRTLYKIKKRIFILISFQQLPVSSVNMGEIVVWLVLVCRTSTRGVTTMGHVCVAPAGLGKIAPKVVSKIVKSECYFMLDYLYFLRIFLGLIIYISFNFPQVFFKIRNMKFIYLHPTVKSCLSDFQLKNVNVWNELKLIIVTLFITC